MASQARGFARTFWLALLVVLSIAVLVLLLRSMESEKEEAPQAQPTPSTGWTTVPEDGVEVNLPETPTRNVPPDEAEPDGESSVEAG